METPSSDFETSLARIFTVAGIIAVASLALALVPSVPGISGVVLAEYSVSAWIAIILLPLMAFVSLGFLSPAKQLASAVLRQNVQDRDVLATIEPRTVNAMHAFCLLLVLMLMHSFAARFAANPIMASATGLRGIVDIVAAIVGIVALIRMCANLMKLLPMLARLLARSIAKAKTEIIGT